MHAAPCLCTLRYRVLLCSRRACARRGDVREEEKMREGMERPYDAAITPHAGSICTLLFVSWFEKNAGDLPRPKRQLIPSPRARRRARWCVSAFPPNTPVCVYMCAGQTQPGPERNHPFVAFGLCQPLPGKLGFTG